MRNAAPSSRPAAFRLREEGSIMASIARVTPRLDKAPEHTCGNWFRAGVVTVGCPGCQLRTMPVPTSGRGLR